MARKSATPAPDRPLGRAVAAGADWDRIIAATPVLPRIFKGAPPRKSPDNYRYMPIDDWHQRRGFCVGYSRARQLQQRSRIPSGATDRAEPLPGIRVSPLYPYAQARMYAREHGMDLGAGDGAIVSHALLAGVDHGYVAYDVMPCPPPVEDAWNNETPPPPAAVTKGEVHKVLAYALADSWDAILEGIAGGHIAVIGVQIPAGMQQTRPEDGYFSWSGPYLGGHAFLFLDYDLDKDEAIVGNSWAQWGWRDSQAAGNFSNMGRCSLTSLSQEFTQSKMQRGLSEATFCNKLGGFAPAVTTFDSTLIPPAH